MTWVMGLLIAAGILTVVAVVGIVVLFEAFKRGQ